jgi:hypothetical protein
VRDWARGHVGGGRTTHGQASWPRTEHAWRRHGYTCYARAHASQAAAVRAATASISCEAGARGWARVGMRTWSVAYRSAASLSRCGGVHLWTCTHMST